MGDIAGRMFKIRGRVGKIVPAILLGIALSLSAVAIAGPRGTGAGEPKRSYGSIDVIMYQTSW